MKPQNVLLNDDGQAKVTDFGIARSLDVHGVTQTGTVLGTSDYIAPEQARGQKVDPKTDIYSLGVVLYELLTGEVPFSGDNFVAVAMRHVNEPPPSVLEHRPDCPVRVDLAIQRAMAKDPADRFASMDELCAELEACLAELDGRDGEGATMIVPPPPRPRRASRSASDGDSRSGIALIVLLAGAARRRRRVPAALDRFGEEGAPRRVGDPEAGPLQGSPPTTLKETAPSTTTRRRYATDRNPATSWTTEHYSNFTRTASASSCERRERCAGKDDRDASTARLRRRDPGAATPSGGRSPTSRATSRSAGTRTFSVDTHGRKYRYYVVWLKLPSTAAGRRSARLRLRR